MEKCFNDIKNCYSSVLIFFSISSECLLVIICLLLVPAKIHQIRGEQTVLEGDNLQLTCETFGRPEANITWTKEKTGNHGNSVLQEGKVLTITKKNSIFEKSVSVDTSTFPSVN